MAHVFISYSRQDTPIVDRLARRLADASIETWLDRNDIRGGDKWRASIVRAIKSADAVVVALSPAAVASDNVRKEIDIAEQIQKPLLPVEVRPATLSDDLAYQLIGLQTIDLARDFDAGVGKLLESLRFLHGSPSAYWRPPAPVLDEIRHLSDDPALSATDRLAIGNMKLQIEFDRALEQRYLAKNELIDRSLARARRQDELRAGGRVLEAAALAVEGKHEQQERETLDLQIAQLQDAGKLALAQLRVLFGLPAQPARNLFDGIR